MNTVLLTVGESGIFSNTVCVAVSNTVLLLFGIFESTVLLLLVNFFNFWITVLHTVQILFCITVGTGVENYCVFLACVNSNR